MSILNKQFTRRQFLGIIGTTVGGYAAAKVLSGCGFIEPTLSPEEIRNQEIETSQNALREWYLANAGLPNLDQFWANSEERTKVFRHIFTLHHHLVDDRIPVDELLKKLFFFDQLPFAQIVKNDNARYNFVQAADPSSLCGYTTNDAIYISKQSTCYQAQFLVFNNFPRTPAGVLMQAALHEPAHRMSPQYNLANSERLLLTSPKSGIQLTYMGSRNFQMDVAFIDPNGELKIMPDYGDFEEMAVWYVIQKAYLEREGFPDLGLVNRYIHYHKIFESDILIPIGISGQDFISIKKQQIPMISLINRIAEYLTEGGFDSQGAFYRAYLGTQCVELILRYGLNPASFFAQAIDPTLNNDQIIGVIKRITSRGKARKSLGLFHIDSPYSDLY